MIDADALNEVQSRLESARDLYYAAGESPLTDDEYDAMKSELVKSGRFTGPGFEKEVKLIDPAGWQVKKHLRIMSGIGFQARNAGEVKTLMADWPMKVLASLKYDGLGLELQYDDGGDLVAAVLRGDGTEGEDVLVNARQCRGVLSKMNTRVPGGKAVYGELVISWNNLKGINGMRDLDGLAPYKTPRNAVSLIRSTKAPNLRRTLPFLNFKAFDAYPRVSSDQRDILVWLKDLGFDAVDAEMTDWTNAWGIIEKLNADRMAMKYQCDGIVLRDHQSPDAMVKVKFPADAAVATVINITETLGRTGVVTPVVEFEPVQLNGVTVRRATGHNSTLLIEKFIGLGPGATVILSRRGDVIPHIESVVTPGAPWTPITYCPSCGSDIVQDDGGSIRRCSADPTECPGTTLGLLLKFCRAAGIDDIGPATAALLCEAGIDTPGELYNLDSTVLAALPTKTGEFGMAKAAKIVASIQSKSSFTFGELLGALGVEGCATSVMTSVTDRFSDPDQWPALTAAELLAIDGVGPERANAILRFIDLRWNDLVAPLLAAVSLVRSDGPLSGKVFCITLELKSGSRTEMEARIRRAGGGVKSSVSRAVTHLVCNIPDANTSKHQRAIDLGLPIISEDVLIAMMGDGQPAEVSPTETDPF